MSTGKSTTLLKRETDKTQKIVRSSYKTKDVIICVKSIFNGDKNYEDLLYQLVQNKLCNY